MEEKDWRRLLDRMKEGSVVPVIGSRLLVGADGSSSLYAPLARQLLADHRVKSGSISLPPFRELPEAVALLKGLLDDPEDFDDLYSKINTALNPVEAKTPVVPLPLQQLAGIRDFKLMVTLTADELLAAALASEDRAVNAVVHSPRLSTKEFADLKPDWEQHDGVVQLLYLFGKARPTPLYAIHDEDVLEYAHNIISLGNNVPKIFLDALRERNLLLIGCNFPDWLSRFFLRATRNGPLAESKSKAWLVDRLSSEDPFIGFLDTYSPKTSVLSDVDPVQFVAELAQRWHDDQPRPQTSSAPSAETAQPEMTAPLAAAPTLPDRAVFFISYSRTTDLQHALKLKEALTTELKVKDEEIWFDKDELEPGDVFTQRIFNGIRNCQYFLPVVSRQATQREEAFVFREWDAATVRLLGMNRRYVMPLVVDEVNQPEVYDQTSVNAWRSRDINFCHAPAGQPDAATLKSLQELLRKARSASGSAP